MYHGPNDLRLEEREVPAPSEGEVVVRVDACGICGTDLRIAAGQHRAYGPRTTRVPGHEIVGTVAASRTVAVTEGARVFVAPNLSCASCAQCRQGRVNLCTAPRAFGITHDGGFATYLTVPADAVAHGNLIGLDNGIDAATAAVAEPLACVLRGQAACGIRRGDVVLIVGAGPIGLLHLLAARVHEPAAVIVSEPGEHRRARAAAWGADATVDPADDLEREIGDGVDVVIVAAPAADAQAQAVRLARPGGRINFFGGLPNGRSEVALDANHIHYKELVVTGTTANTTADCREALRRVADGAIEAAPFVSARHPLGDAMEAFDEARSGEALKVVIEP